MSNVQKRLTLEDRLKLMEKKIRTLETAARLRSSSVGGGGITVQEPGDIILTDANGVVVWRASTDPLKTASTFEQDSGISIPTVWTDVGGFSVDIPEGYHSGHFLIVANCGDTFVTEGNVSVQPIATAVYQDGSTSTGAGPAINSGNSSVSVATSFWSSTFSTVVDPANPMVRIIVAARVIRNGAEVAGNGNWHITASIIFKRGELT
jgi:hypothetical protein